MGGRYSVLTTTGILPALLMGLDAEALRKGASDTLATILSGAGVREGDRVEVTISGIGKDAVGQFAASVRAIKKPVREATALR